MSSPPECYFKINRPTSDEKKPRGLSTDLSAVDCQGERLTVVDAVKGIKRIVNLHGCSSLVELVFFRGNAEIVLDSQDKTICVSHLKFLLIDWPDKSKDQKKDRKRQGVREDLCVLPHEGCCPKENRKLTKVCALLTELLWNLLSLPTTLCLSLVGYAKKSSKRNGPISMSNTMTISRKRRMRNTMITIQTGKWCHSEYVFSKRCVNQWLILAARKFGNSLHVAHAASIKAGLRVHHSFLHMLDACIQDAQSVSAIMKHILAILKDNGISKVVLRSDNAGCYKNAGIIGDISCLENDLPSVIAFIYSESQMGKGPSDRTTSHCKRRINEETNGLKNCRDAAEIFKGTSAYHCHIDGAEEECNIKKIPEISMIFDVRFEDGKVVTRKHSGIGPGKTNVDLSPLNSSLSITSQGLYLSSPAMNSIISCGFLSPDIFWSSYGKPNNSDAKDVLSDEEEKENDDQLLSHPLHEMKGLHKIREAKDTLIDDCINKFSECVENEDAARLIMANDSFQNISISDNLKGFHEGYALKKIKNNKINEKARAAAEEFFFEHRNKIPPRRACPRAFSQSMVTMREADGSYKFEVPNLLSEKQVQGIFSRLEKRRTGVTVAKRKKAAVVSNTITSKSRKRKPRGGEETPNAKKSRSVIAATEESDDDVLNEDGETDDEVEEEDEFEFLKEALMEERDELFLP